MSIASSSLGHESRERASESSFLLQLQEGMSSFFETGREGKRIQTAKG